MTGSVGELLGFRLEDALLTPLHPHLKQWKTFEALRAVTLAGSQRRPHVFVIEDLHWLDKTSEAYLTFINESLPGTPILLLTTYRPGYAVRWAVKTYNTQIALDRLTRQEVDELLHALLGTDPGFAPLVRLLMERAEGNPFFLEESVRMLVESQVLAGARGAYRLVKPFQTIRVPATVQAVLAARIDRLPAEDKHLLQTAAVIGKRIPLALLQAVVDQSDDAVRRGLTHLQAAEFLYDMGLFPDVQYAFTHALTYEVAYGSLLQERRRALHTRIIEAIETLYVDRLAEWSDRLAYHVVRGEVWSKAPAYFRRTPMQSFPSLDSLLWWRGDHERAVESCQRDLPVAAEFKNFPFQVMIQFLLGQAYHALGDYPRALDALRRNVVSLEGELLRERFDLPGLVSVLSRAWLAWCLAECGEFSEGLGVAEEAIQIAETVDDPYSLVVACFGLGALHLQQGGLQEATPALERGLALSMSANLSQLFPLLAAPLGAAYALIGRVAEAMPQLEEAVEQAAALNFMGTHARRLAWLGETYRLAGRIDEAMHLATQALDLSRVHKERGHEAWSLRLLGEVYARQQPPAVEQAEASYRQALAVAAQLAMAPLQAHSHLGLGMLCARTGRPREASTELSAAVDLFRVMDMKRWLPQAEGALARVLA
jgi:tetratricopeptide (TPR) repeat protein